MSQLLFQAISPLTGQPTGMSRADPTIKGRSYRAAPEDEVISASMRASEAFSWAFDIHHQGPFSGQVRCELLHALADGLMDLGDQLLEVTHQETGLALPRLAGERDRAALQLRMYGDAAKAGMEVIASGGSGGGGGSGGIFDLVRDPQTPATSPATRPNFEHILIPLGPVAVFGASNFPYAYSVLGGDTASALAAGCPVVVKGHPLHPGTGEKIAEMVDNTIHFMGLHHGLFSFLPSGGERELAIGAELLAHPSIAAVGFTGSYKAGMALHAMANQRTTPIPVFAEMGSVNPIFIPADLSQAAAEDIAKRIFTSFTSSGGQMCTCPGLVFIQDGPTAQLFIDTMVALVNQSTSQPMLSGRIHAGFRSRLHEVAQVPGVDIIARGSAPKDAHPQAITQPSVLMRTTATTYSRYHTLSEECFGPSTILVTCRDEDEMLAMAREIPGSLAASLFTSSRTPFAPNSLPSRLATTLARHVGRLVINGVTTGVEVTPAMVHGGPFPATNQPNSTAVGPRAIRRWLRPICLQEHV